MAKTIDEIMNRDVLTVRPTDPVEVALRYILEMDITGAAVTDESGKLLGHVSLRDLAIADASAHVAQAMRSPAVVVAANELISDAARRLLDERRHRFVVVDAEGGVVGMVSAVDLLAGVMGLPARHPAAFAHYDKQLDVYWTDDYVLAPQTIDEAPDAPSVLVLLHGKAGVRERVVWAESCPSAYMRLVEMTSLPGEQETLLRRALELGELRFRVARAASSAGREQALRLIQGRAMSALLPSERSLA